MTIGVLARTLWKEDPKLDVQVYNNEHQEGCSREMVLYAENAIIPINISETMNGQEIVGELQTKNQIVDIGPFASV